VLGNKWIWGFGEHKINVEQKIHFSSSLNLHFTHQRLALISFGIFTKINQRENLIFLVVSHLFVEIF
jgi:hypothetical protein